MKTPIFQVLIALIALFYLPACHPGAQSQTTAPQQAAKSKALISNDSILYLVGEGHTLEALQLMKKAGIKDAILQQSRFEEGQKHFSAGLINYEDWAITQARINYAILEILPQQVPETTTAPIPRDQIKKLTEAGQLEAALRLLIPAKPFDGTLVLARIKTAEKNYKLGLIDAANLDRIRGQVSFAILEMSK